MHNENTLNLVSLKCIDFFRQYAFSEVLKEYAKSSRELVVVYSFNNFVDMAILNWCHLFGNEKDDLHWKRVVTQIDHEEFKEYLLKNIDKNESEWVNYWNSMRECRDKSISHFEKMASPRMPDLTTGLDSVNYYYSFIIDDLKEYGHYSHYPSNPYRYIDRLVEKSIGWVAKIMENKT